MCLACGFLGLEDVAIGSNRAFAVSGRSVLIARPICGLFVGESQCNHAQQPREDGKTNALSPRSL